MNRIERLTWERDLLYSARDRWHERAITTTRRRNRAYRQAWADGFAGTFSVGLALGRRASQYREYERQLDQAAAATWIKTKSAISNRTAAQRLAARRGRCLRCGKVGTSTRGLPMPAGEGES